MTKPTWLNEEPVSLRRGLDGEDRSLVPAGFEVEGTVTEVEQQVDWQGHWRATYTVVSHGGRFGLVPGATVLLVPLAGSVTPLSSRRARKSPDDPGCCADCGAPLAGEVCPNPVCPGPGGDPLRDLCRQPDGTVAEAQFYMRGKEWLKDHQDADPKVRAAVESCIWRWVAG